MYFYKAAGAISKKRIGFTLIEVVIASAIFAIAFGGLLVGQQMARRHAENALISFAITHSAQGLLEAIQSYPYEDEQYTNASNAFTFHTATFGPYDTAKSGMYKATNTTDSPDIPLPEESLTLRYYPTTLGSSPTAFKPFEPNLDLGFQNNDQLLGPEIEDKDGASNYTFYRISETQRILNIFATDEQGQEKYFFMDDVDDFDGYQETREILPGISVTYQISVSGIFDNETNYIYSGTATTVPQNPYSVMTQKMSSDHFLSLLPVGSTDTQAQEAAFGYYQKMLFKKITVRATWVYPSKSNDDHVLIIDGGKMNPKGNAR